MNINGNYGSEPHEMHRRDDPETSKERAHVIDSVSWDERIHEYIKAQGMDGATIREVSVAFGGDNTQVCVSPVQTLETQRAYF